MGKAIVEEFKGKPTICLNPDSKFRFSFQLRKAEMIIASIQEIKEFANTGSFTNSALVSKETFTPEGKTEKIPLIALTHPQPKEKESFSFGQSKAKLIAENEVEIEDFVKSQTGG